jgi:GNAT superfamily N-acetyltransferase
MKNTLTVIKAIEDSPEAAYARALYEEAFPEIERCSFESLMACTRSGKADFFVYRDGGENVGFCVVLLPGNYAYGLFAAINRDSWNKGYGSQLVREVIRSYPDRAVVLDIEPVDETADNYEERRRRLHFFEKNGFHDTGYEMRDESGPYRILSNAEGFDLEGFVESYEILPEIFPGTRIYRDGIEAPVYDPEADRP